MNILKQTLSLIVLSLALSSCGENNIDLTQDKNNGFEIPTASFEDAIIFNANMNETLESKIPSCTDMQVVNSSENSSLNIDNQNELTYIPKTNFHGTDVLVVSCYDINKNKVAPVDDE